MKKLMISALTILYSASITQAQANNANSTFQAVSRNIVLPVVVAQNDSPLLVEQFLVVRNEKGSIETDYKVKNVGAKNIRSYRIARLYSDHTGYIGFGAMPADGRSLKPEMSVNTFTSKRILAASEVGKPKGAMKKIVFFMVVDVEFEDGTMFDASSILESFDEHLKMYETAYDLVNE